MAKPTTPAPSRAETSTTELSRETIMAWRAFVGSKAFLDGIDHLRTAHAPNPRGKTAEELLRESVAWGAYQQALNDLTDVLAFIPKPERSIETPGLLPADRED